MADSKQQQLHRKQRAAAAAAGAGTPTLTTTDKMHVDTCMQAIISHDGVLQKLGST